MYSVDDLHARLERQKQHTAQLMQKAKLLTSSSSAVASAASPDSEPYVSASSASSSFASSSKPSASSASASIPVATLNLVSNGFETVSPIAVPSLVRSNSASVPRTPQAAPAPSSASSSMTPPSAANAAPSSQPQGDSASTSPMGDLQMARKLQAAARKNEGSKIPVLRSAIPSSPPHFSVTPATPVPAAEQENHEPEEPVVQLQQQEHKQQHQQQQQQQQPSAFAPSASSSSSNNNAISDLRTKLLQRAKELTVAQSERKAKLDELVSYSSEAVQKSRETPHQGEASGIYSSSSALSLSQLNGPSASDKKRSASPAAAIKSVQHTLSPHSAAAAELARALEINADASRNQPRYQEQQQEEVHNEQQQEEQQQHQQQQPEPSQSSSGSSNRSRSEPRRRPSTTPTSSSRPSSSSRSSFASVSASASAASQSDNAAAETRLERQRQFSAALRAQSQELASSSSLSASTISSANKKSEARNSNNSSNLNSSSSSGHPNGNRQKRVAEANRQRTTLTSKINQTQLEYDRLTEQLRSSEQREESLAVEKAQYIEERKISVKSLTSQIEDVHHNISLLQDDIRRLKDVLRMEREQFAPTLDALQVKRQRVEQEYEEKMTGVRKRREENDSKKQKRTDRFFELEKKVITLRKQHHVAQSEADNAAQAVDALRRKEAELEAALKQHVYLAQKIKDEENALQSQVSALKEEEHAFRAKLASLRDKFGLEISVVEEEFAHKLAQQQFAKMRELETNRIQNLQAEVDSLRKELILRSEENDKMKETFMMRRAEEQNRLNGLKDRHQRAAEYISLKEMEMSKASGLLSQLEQETEKRKMEEQQQQQQQGGGIGGAVAGGGSAMSTKIEEEVMQRQIVLMDAEESNFLLQVKAQADKYATDIKHIKADISAEDTSLVALESDIASSQMLVQKQDEITESLRGKHDEVEHRSIVLQQRSSALEKKKQDPAYILGLECGSAANISEEILSISSKLSNESNRVAELDAERATLLAERTSFSSSSASFASDPMAVATYVTKLNDKISEVDSYLSESRARITALTNRSQLMKRAGGLVTEIREEDKWVNAERESLNSLKDQVQRDTSLLSDMTEKAAAMNRAVARASASRTFLASKRQQLTQSEAALRRLMTDREIKLNAIRNWKSAMRSRLASPAAASAASTASSLAALEKAKESAISSLEQEQKNVEDIRQSLRESTEKLQREELQLARRLDQEQERVSSFAEYANVVEGQIRSVQDRKRVLEAEWAFSCEREYSRVKMYQAKRSADEQILKDKIESGLKVYASTQRAVYLQLKNQYGEETSLQMMNERMRKEEEVQTAQLMERLQYLRRVFERLETIDLELSERIEEMNRLQQEKDSSSLTPSQEEAALQSEIQQQRENRLKQVESMIEKYKAQVFEVTETRSKLESVANQEKSVAEGLQREMEQLQVEVNRLQSERDVGEMATAEMERTVQEEHKKSFDQLLREIERERERALQHAEVVCKPIRQQIDDKTKSAKELERSITALRREMEELKSQMEAKEADTNHKVSSLRSQKQQLKHRLSVKQQALDSMYRDLNRAERDLGIISSAAERLEQTLSNRNLLSRVEQNLASLSSAEESSSLPSSPRQSQEHQPPPQSRSPPMPAFLPTQPSSKLQQSSSFSSFAPSQDWQSSAISSPSSSSDSSSLRILTSASDLAPSVSSSSSVISSSSEAFAAASSFILFTPSSLGRRPGGNLLLFGPNTLPLTREEVDYVRSLCDFMCNGTHVLRKNAQGLIFASNSAANRSISALGDPRGLFLTNELTRLEFRERGKKVAESFIKLEHILSIEKASGLPLMSVSAGPSSSRRPVSSSSSSSRQELSNTQFVVVLKEKKVLITAANEEEARQWLEGLELILLQRNNLFYLRMNLRQL